MKILHCPKCKENKADFIYANKYNSTKFCPDCGTALDTNEVFEDMENQRRDDWIYEIIRNAILKM